MNEPNVKYEDLKEFAFKLLTHVGVCHDSAEYVSEGLCDTSLSGIDSHGIKLLPHYVQGAIKGRINKNPNFEFDLKAHCAGVLNADHSYGHHSGVVAMKKAIELAKKHGMGAIAVNSSSHFGAAGYFALKAAQEDMVGLSFTHADSLMLSKNSTRPFFGTNPISFCAPVEGEEPFYLDMATTNVSWNKVMNTAAKGKSLEPGWAVDENGDEVLDAKVARALFPSGDYKGFALSMMVEILCSILSGAPYGRNITSMYKTPIEESRHLGHFFMAINVEAFQELDIFKKRMKSMMEELRAEPQKEGEAVLCPGDPQKQYKKERLETGIPIFSSTWEEFEKLSQEFDIPLPKTVGA
tara:strand:+ start:136910 stop:137965 length:1056 start_codon:yes stop_codon:yes gene_type:complete